MFKKYWLIFLAFLNIIFLNLMAGAAQAQGLKKAADELGKAGGPAGVKDLPEPEILVGQIIQLVLSFVGVVFLALAVYGGMVWMTARGNEEQVQKGRKIISRAIVGLAIVFLSYAITLAVSAVFGL